MAKLGYYFTSAFLKLLAFLPSPLLYGISTGLYFIVFYVVGYRKKVVKNNLINSFPNYNSTQIDDVTRKFYRHFCDTIVEIIKLLHVSEKQLDKRITFKNIEHLQQFHQQKKSVTVLMSHYANWEYIPFISCKLDAASASIYHVLKNKEFDTLMKRMRGQFGLKLFPMETALRSLIGLQKKQGDYIVGVIADQSPHSEYNRVWLRFLNQDTYVFMGPEKIATKFNHAVAYMKMTKPKRGHYVLEVVPVLDNAKNAEPFEIIKTYYQLLEEQINEQPEFWLWTHRRWKHTRIEHELLIQ